jgi:hypothetical protein
MDTIVLSMKALKAVETDEKARDQARRELARDGLLMVAPGRW